MKIKASDVENAVIDFFQKKGGWARKIHVSGIPIEQNVNGVRRIVAHRKNPKMRGLGDVYGLLLGVPYRIEVKRPGDTEKKHQEEDRHIWEGAGGKSMIVKDIDDFLTQFKEG